MRFEKKIANMKCLTFDQASKHAIYVYSEEGFRLGKLVPVGKWILNELETIELIRTWRQKTMRMFLTQFESTFDGTYSYLDNLVIGQEARILFMLYDGEDRMIGHIGMAYVNGETGELDNLMRGIEGGDPRLVYFSELALLDWCFKDLGIKQCDVRVLSYNWQVITLHEEVGYVFVDNEPLKKYEKNGVIFHDVVNLLESNVKYGSTKLVLTKSDFYKKNDWLLVR